MLEGLRTSTVIKDSVSVLTVYSISRNDQTQEQIDRSSISETEYMGFRMGFWESVRPPKTRKHGHYMNKFSISTEFSQLL